jgi:lactoylglutathione lyase
VTRFREPFPILIVDDVDRAVEFYCSTFGFEKAYTFEQGDETAYAFLRLEPLGIGVARRTGPEDPGVAVWIYTDDVDEAAARLRAAGATEVLPPTDQPWGERMCSFRDADGHLLHIALQAGSS